MKFFYRIVNSNNESQTGYIEASDKYAAITKLQNMGYTVANITIEDDNKNIKEKNKISLKKKITYLFIFINIALTIYMFFGVFSLKGSWFSPLTLMLKEKYNINLKFDKLVFNMIRCDFYNLEIETIKKDILKAEELKFSYSFKSIFLGKYINIFMNGKKIKFLSERKVILDTDNIEIEDINLLFKGNIKNGINGDCDVSLKSISSLGKNSLFKSLGEMLNIKSIKELSISDTKLQFKINSYKMNFNNIELENKDFYLYGKGFYILGKDMDFQFEIKYITDNLEDSILDKNKELDTIHFSLQGYIHSPKIQIKDAKLNIKKDFSI